MSISSAPRGFSARLVCAPVTGSQILPIHLIETSSSASGIGNCGRALILGGGYCDKGAKQRGQWRLGEALEMEMWTRRARFGTECLSPEKQAISGVRAGGRKVIGRASGLKEGTLSRRMLVIVLYLLQEVLVHRIVFEEIGRPRNSNS
jgi:hypothetical protein